MEDGAEQVLVGRALQDDLDVLLQQAHLREELGLRGKRLRLGAAVVLHLEHGALHGGHKQPGTIGTGTLDTERGTNTQAQLNIGH